MISKNLKDRLVTSLILLIIVLLIFKENLILVYCLIILGVISLIEFFNITKEIFKNKLYTYFTNFFFILYISFFCIIFFYLANLLYPKIILFSFLFGCIASDIGGYFVGKFFKGPKLTKISPNKTISGAIGSLVFTCITISLLAFYFINNFNYIILIVSIITSVSCQLGDILFSFLKRKANIKDTGKIFPGHGGVLDRLDGIYFGIPAGFISLILLY